MLPQGPAPCCQPSPGRPSSCQQCLSLCSAGDSDILAEDASSPCSNQVEVAVRTCKGHHTSDTACHGHHNARTVMISLFHVATPGTCVSPKRTPHMEGGKQAVMSQMSLQPVYLHSCCVSSKQMHSIGTILSKHKFTHRRCVQQEDYTGTA